MAIKKRPSGSKLSRTEIVQVRLDPRLRYLAELAARKQRRTLSSFIEWALEKSLESVLLYEGSVHGSHDISIADRAAELWDIDEAERLVKLAWKYPELLTHEEQIIWKLIRDNGYLWKGRYDEQGAWTWNWNKESSLIQSRLNEHWEDFQKVAKGEAEKDILPTWVEKKMPEKADDFDPDIPF
jgi:hypothetical protein